MHILILFVGLFISICVVKNRLDIAVEFTPSMTSIGPLFSVAQPSLVTLTRNMESY